MLANELELRVAFLVILFTFFKLIGGVSLFDEFTYTFLGCSSLFKCELILLKAGADLLLFINYDSKFSNFSTRFFLFFLAHCSFTCTL